MAGAPLGNKNGVGRSGTQWRDAIRKALARDKQALERVAVKLIACAEEGDMTAIKELGDRLDGKATQTVNGTLTHELRAAEATDEQLLDIIAGSGEGIARSSDSEKELH